jgi:uncharacterized protein
VNLTPGQVLLLVAAAAMAGALNAVAGGGSFFTFPALLFTGVPPIQANATSSVAVWPGSLASAVAYRTHVPKDRRLVLWMSGASLVGGVAGGVLLVKTPQSTFAELVPYLLLVATLLFTFGDRLKGRQGSGPSLGLAGAVLVQLGIAVYGGYFGGGMGIVMLAAYALIGLEDIHEMNALKSLTAVVLNGVANVTFVLSRVVLWTPGLLMIGGAVAGGYAGATLARRLPQAWVRRFVVVTGWSLTAYFFARKLS